MKSIGRGCAIAVAAVACSSGAERAPRGDSAVEVSASTGRDPCTLVSQAEMEGLLGPLAEPPFRATSNREPDPRGDACFYRGADRRNVTLIVDFDDGEMSFGLLAGTGQAITDILTGYDAQTDTLEGGWDRIGAAFGQLIVLKGKTAVQVDPFGSRLGLAGAVRVASIALSHLDHPVPHDGAAAARARAPDTVPERDPCALVTRAEVEALMGPLASAPAPSADRSECAFETTQQFMGSPVERVLSVQWSDGFYALGQERNSLEGATKVMAAQMDADLPSLGDVTAGAGEPWDERVTLVGGVVSIVRRDVLLKLAGDGVGGFDEDKALALLRLAAKRL